MTKKKEKTNFFKEWGKDDNKINEKNWIGVGFFFASVFFGYFEKPHTPHFIAGCLGCFGLVGLVEGIKAIKNVK